MLIGLHSSNRILESPQKFLEFWRDSIISRHLNSYLGPLKPSELFKIGTLLVNLGQPGASGSRFSLFYLQTQLIWLYHYAGSTNYIRGGENGPFNVVSGLGEEEALSVGLNDERRSWVDGHRALSSVVASTLHGNQQQFELTEAQPTASQRSTC